MWGPGFYILFARGAIRSTAPRQLHR